MIAISSSIVSTPGQMRAARMTGHRCAHAQLALQTVPVVPSFISVTYPQLLGVSSGRPLTVVW